MQKTLWLAPVTALALLAAHGCSSDETQTGSTSSTGTAGTGGMGGGGGQGGSGELSLSLPQAVDGAMLANPAVYAEIPLHVAVTGPADSVEVTIGDTTVTATDADGDDTWTALLPIGGLPDSTVAIEARGQVGSAAATVTADLVLSSTGVQLTVFDDVGFAGAPRIHGRDDAVWLTWTDRFEPEAESWARRIDGGGRWQGDRVRLVGATEETLYARAAFGNEGIGLLYQAHGTPYTTRFKIVDFEGNEVLAPIDLDPQGWNGSFGGDITFDGESFVAVWRINDGTGGGEVRWLRVEETSGTVTGPVVVAAAGTGNPVGGFEPFSFVDVERIGDVSLVSFVRENWHGGLAMVIPKSQLATVTQDGTVSAEQFLGYQTSLTFHREARLYGMGSEVTAIWSAKDLTSTEVNIPNHFFGARSDGSGVMTISGDGAVVVDAVDDRDEPFLAPHPVHYGVLAWLDHRAYTLEPNNGRIELYAATVNDDLSTGDPVVFPHARFVAGVAQLKGLTVGTNVMLSWLDQRHGSGIMDPKPELWLETAWY